MVKSTSRKTNKNDKLMFWVFAVLILLIVIAVTVVIVLANRPDPNTSEKFFETNDSQYVIEAKPQKVDDEILGDNAPINSFNVYYRNGDTITGYNLYYEFANEEAAKNALSYYQGLKGEEINSVELDGKYIVLSANKSQYEGMTYEFIKQWTELFKEADEDASSTEEKTDTVDAGTGDASEEASAASTDNADGAVEGEASSN
ncbi:hypothetical protein IKF30_00080 [Candidatus Saccharibacteria bacterium]|nr:hypothetical protein [Candidatus Saccharibacteria bacterium]